MSKLKILGVALFFLGGLGLMVVLLAHGGAAKSRQFAVWTRLWSGHAGPQPRRQLRGAVLIAATGAQVPSTLMTVLTGLSRPFFLPSSTARLASRYRFPGSGSSRRNRRAR